LQTIEGRVADRVAHGHARVLERFHHLLTSA
jgi:hypothetical protein